MHQGLRERREGALQHLEPQGHQEDGELRRGPGGHQERGPLELERVQHLEDGGLPERREGGEPLELRVRRGDGEHQRLRGVERQERAAERHQHLPSHKRWHGKQEAAAG